jgi:putative FmdB family regulatory protein
MQFASRALQAPDQLILVLRFSYQTGNPVVATVASVGVASGMARKLRQGLLRQVIEKEKMMPYYEYKCGKCGNRFTVKETFEQHDRHAKPKCPKCQSRKVGQLIASVHVKTSKKS